MTVEENVLAGFDQHYRGTLAETLLRLPRFGREERAFRVAARCSPAFRRPHRLRRRAGAQPAVRPPAAARDRTRARTQAAAAAARRAAAGLTHGEIESLKALIRLLAQRGITIILVEHHVDMVMTVSIT
jgi:branched-chain amino acid transport system permease protein